MILRQIIVLTLIYMCMALSANAQDMKYTKKVIADLCNEDMAGRGYVNNGVNKAADYLSKEFRKMKCKKFNNSYFQSFSFPINTFPTKITCTLDHKVLVPGRDFLLAPNSSSCQGTYRLLHYNIGDSLETKLYDKKRIVGMKTNEAIVLKNAPRNFEEIPWATNMVSTDKKMIHSLSQQDNGGCKLIFPDSVIDGADSLYIRFKNKQIERFESKNVIAYIPAKKKKNRDKYIVFSAHYDHLGKMGSAMFPGASDNASGTAMVLNLAKYFSKKRPDYTMVFMLFAGEEVGLLGSEFFTSHPTFNIKNIKSLINLDIMGSAENGIVVVNATEFPEQFDKLKRINTRKAYLPEVRPRGPTSNSDHYYFYKKGIPSFFIYSNGGPGFYHDIDDTPESLPLANYENIYKLLIDFVNTF